MASPLVRTTRRRSASALLGAVSEAKKSRQTAAAAPTADTPTLTTAAAAADVDEEMRPPSPLHDSTAAATPLLLLSSSPSPPPSAPQRSLSQRDRKPTIRATESAEDEARSSAVPAPPLNEPQMQTNLAVLQATMAAPMVGLAWLNNNPFMLTTATTARQLRPEGLKVPKSSDRWCVVGVWLASRDLPLLPFWLPLVDPKTGQRLELPVPYKTMMATLSPKYNDREQILLHVRVVQRRDPDTLRLICPDEVRYLCTDIAVSYEMGDNAFKWISFHPTIFQVCCLTWNSSFNRSELQDHLAMANTKGGMVFQSPAAATTRAFLRTILCGKGLRAQCTMDVAPVPVLVQAMQQQQQRQLTQQAGMQQITMSGRTMTEKFFVFRNGVFAPAAASAPSSSSSSVAAAVDASSTAPSAAASESPAADGAVAANSPSLQHTFVLFTNALANSEPLWFHPVALEAREMQAQVAASTMFNHSAAFGKPEALAIPPFTSSAAAAAAAAAVTSPDVPAASSPSAAEVRSSDLAKARTKKDASVEAWKVPFLHFSSVATDSLPSVRICNRNTAAAATATKSDSKYRVRAAAVALSAVAKASKPPNSRSTLAESDAAPAAASSVADTGVSLRLLFAAAQSEQVEDKTEEEDKDEPSSCPLAALEAAAVAEAAAAPAITLTGAQPSGASFSVHMSAQDLEQFQEFRRLQGLAATAPRLSDHRELSN